MSRTRLDEIVEGYNVEPSAQMMFGLDWRKQLAAAFPDKPKTSTFLETVIVKDPINPDAIVALVQRGARAIAERAFRHGVERLHDQECFCRFLQTRHDVSSVQPAPAGEKPHLHIWPGPYEPCRVCGTPLDRRRGERRKGMCDCGHPLHAGYVCKVDGKCVAGWIPSWCDRRSGKDRRKK